MSNCCLTPHDTLVKSKVDLEKEHNFAHLAKALSHPARVRILRSLLALDSLGGCLNSDLVSELGLAQSTVSEHLRILKQAGFIHAEPNPPKVCYRINKPKLQEFEAMSSWLGTA